MVATGRLTFKNNVAEQLPSTVLPLFLKMNCGGALVVGISQSVSLLGGVDAFNNTVAGADGHGGAACVQMGSSLTIAGPPSLIANNSATGSGGGIFLSGGARLQLSRAVIEGNTADAGGGIYLQDDSKASLTDCVVRANAAAADGGGGVARDLSGLNMTNCTVADNSVRALARASRSLAASRVVHGCRPEARRASHLVHAPFHPAPLLEVELTSPPTRLAPCCRRRLGLGAGAASCSPIAPRRASKASPLLATARPLAGEGPAGCACGRCGACCRACAQRAVLPQSKVNCLGEPTVFALHRSLARRLAVILS